MFSVMPPPPTRYASPLAYQTGTANGMPVPALETSNQLRRPEGNWTLQAGEGTYTLRDDLLLATPPPHPDAVPPPPTATNPLSTVPAPRTSGVRLSLVVIKPRGRQRTRGKHATGMGMGKLADLRRIEEDGNDNGNGNNGDDRRRRSDLDSATEIKRRKPRNNILKSTSSFVSRVLVHDAFARRLADRPQHAVLAFANINRAFQLLDLGGVGAPAKAKHEPLAKVFFTRAHMLCHAVNETTKGLGHLDVIMGSSAGDVIWWEPMSQRYMRLNKNGAVNPTPVLEIAWVPGSENLFLAAHEDGSLVMYDKERDDPGEDETGGESNEEDGVNEGGDNYYDDDDLDAADGRPYFRVVKSARAGVSSRANPVAVWKVSNQPVNALAFAPDGRHLAAACEDGTLRMIDYTAERMEDVFHSYYGGLECVAYSPDGRYVVTGGQDDLVAIWSVAARRLVARCPGHHSWVAAVAFDPWRCDGRSYRFGSVGADCHLLLWDFGPAMLHRPRMRSVAGGGGGGGGSGAASVAGSVAGVGVQRRRRRESLTPSWLRTDEEGMPPGSVFGSPSAAGGGERGLVDHPVEPRAAVAQLPPILSRVASDDPLCWLGFVEDAILTSSLEGHIRTWDRPAEPMA